MQEEWRVQMLPIQFLFANPPLVPPHIPQVLELQATKWELKGLEGGSVPPHFALDVRGLLYPDRGEKGGTAARRSRLRGHLETSISMVLPLVSEHVLKGVAESVLKRLVERMKQDVEGSLLSDFQSFRRESMRKQLTKKNAAQRSPAQSDTDPSRLP
ncbi:hypothetical protein Taro_023456 [Colocasia esculenta]|uniref:Uncharacterized protein n=1 Tax=Colocasia esculenta TaxID=4460 RepID=A0A843V4Q4_COLES|nr:hypothetical protein [Colocasia esculenta]